MPSDLRRYVTLLDSLAQDPPPRLLRRAQAVLRILGGESPESVADAFALSKRHLLVWAESVAAEGLHGWLDRRPVTSERLVRARAGLAQMLVGVIAERHFEQTSTEIVGAQGYRIEDERVGRTDTDYRLVAADGRAICRFNIKFHGTAFAKSLEWVSLEPDDCFALATYKIDAALKKQNAERLPFVFLIISVLKVPRASVEQHISEDWAWLAALTNRATEEAIVNRLLTEPWVEPIRHQVRDAAFRVLSARRAYQLMRDKLFERVHALRIPRFNRVFRNAEIDMHLSLSSEMIGFDQFLQLLANAGPLELAVRFDRGEI